MFCFPVWVPDWSGISFILYNMIFMSCILFCFPVCVPDWSGNSFILYNTLWYSWVFFFQFVFLIGPAILSHFIIWYPWVVFCFVFQFVFLICAALAIAVMVAFQLSIYNARLNLPAHAALLAVYGWVGAFSQIILYHTQTSMLTQNVTGPVGPVTPRCWSCKRFYCSYKFFLDITRIPIYKFNQKHLFLSILPSFISKTFGAILERKPIDRNFCKC